MLYKGTRLRTRILAAGVPRIVHVVAKFLKANLENGEDNPLIGVRRSDEPEKVKLYRHVEILGPSSLMHTPDDPVPGTDGRGICVLRTEAAIRVYFEPKPVTKPARKPVKLKG